MRFRAQLRRQAGAKRFNLFVRQSSRLAVEADEPRDARNLQNLQPLAQRQAHEHVTWKQWQLQLHPPVLPAPYAVIERQKIFDRFFLELQRHTLFVVRAGVRHVPVRLFKCRRQVCRLSHVSFRNAWRYHRRGHRNLRIQLRPVSHRAEIDVTPLTTTTYSYFSRDSTDFSASSRETIFSKS